MLHYGILIQIQTGVGGLAIFNQHWHLWCFTAGSSEHSSSSSLLPLPQRVQAGQPTNRGGAGHNILKLTTDQWLILWWPLNYTGENRSEDRTYPALAHWHLWRLQEEQRVSLFFTSRVITMSTGVSSAWLSSMWGTLCVTCPACIPTMWRWY